MDARFEVEESQASFRGVAFHVKKRSRDFGRRGPTHEAPQRDEPDGEDLGRKVRAFKLDAVIIGQGATDEAMAADCRRRTLDLLAALEDRAGPGIYRDPWHGRWTVICRSGTQVDDEDRMFVADFSITFEESGDARYPLSRLDTATGVEKASSGLSAASATAFLRRFSLAGRPQFVKSAANVVAGAALSRLKGLGLPQLPTTDAIGIADAGASASAVASNLAALLEGDFGDSLANLFRDMAASSYSRRAGLGSAAATRTAFADLSSFGADLPPVSAITATRQAQADNQAALVSLIRRQSVTEEARALAASTWDSQDQAIGQRDDTLARLDAVMAEAGASGDDEVFSAAQALRVAVIQDVDSRAPTARVRNATMDAVLPARVVAHKLLGDGRKADDLVKRNNVANPAFMPAGRALEYLSDD